MSKAATKQRPLNRIRSRLEEASSLASGSEYPGACLTTLDVARLARDVVAGLFKINPLAMVVDQRGPRNVAFARSLAMHLCHVVAGRRHDEIAAAFRRNRSTASHHFEVVENLRSDPEFDLFLEILERRFTLVLASLDAKPYQQWGKALRSLATAVMAGALEADAHFDAKYVVTTFRSPEKRGRCE